MAHNERAHARLSASGSKRWLTCTPSVKLEEGFEDKTSDFAEEGTLAHELSELKLNEHLQLIKPDVLKERLNVIESHTLFALDMHRYVESYTDFVIERINDAYARCADPVLQLEQRLDFSQWVPGGFGTGDVVIVADKILDVIDLKYGKGVPVEADHNTQLMLYGLGAYSEYGMLYDFDTVRLTIVQPRLDSISSWEIPLNDLLEWGDQYVYPRAKLAMKGEGEFQAGDHCKFCKAKAVCRARADLALESAKYEFALAATLSIEEIADVLARAGLLKDWASDVEKYALDQAEKHNVRYPGWKLVEGRSNRKYSDEEMVAGMLMANGYDQETIYKPKELNGITEMEKRLGKKQFASLLADWVVKPSGKPTLVPESDKRPELNSVSSAAADFAD